MNADPVAEVEAALRRWLADAAYASYDIYDGLAGRFPWSLAQHQHWAARALTQAVKQSPVNVRPLLGIRRYVFAKSMSDLASAAWLRFRTKGDVGAAGEARTWLARLRADVRPGYAGPCWGLPFAYVSRFATSGAGTPNLFWTINAASAFLDAWECAGDRADLDIARGALEFIRHDLGVVDEGRDGVWFRYFAGQDACVYNVAALCGALFRRVARHTGEGELDNLGARALHFVAAQQNANGSWFYARGPRGEWVDGFHTAYILEAFLEAVHLHQDAAAAPVLQRGVDYWRRRCFDADAMPRYKDTSRFPLDVQNAAQAIQTLSRLATFDPAQREPAERTAAKVIATLFRFTAPDRGYFIASRGRWFTNRVPFVRWGQAPMLLALDQLLALRAGVPPSWTQR